MKTLSEHIHDHAQRTPEALAFASAEGARMSWQAYDERAERFARVLHSLGLERGERVAIVLPDGPGVHVAFVAAERAGLVTMGIGPRAGREELLHLLRKSGASVLISRGHYRELEMATFFEQLRQQESALPLRHHVVVDDDFESPSATQVEGRSVEAGVLPAVPTGRAMSVDEIFLLNSTSGTTGMPKCVTHDQARWNHFHRFAVESGELHSDDVFMSAIPAPFGFGLWTAHFTPTLLGAGCIVMENFSAASLLDSIERERVSVLAAVSTQFVMMLNEPEAERRDLSSLRVLYTGGEAVPYERASEFEERTGAAVLQFYGSNETGALSRTGLRDSREVRLRTAGRVIEEMQVRLFNDEGVDTTASGRGQPACKGPLLSRGYWNDDEANAELYTEDAWMRTGDIATIDEQGVLSVAGRAGDFIIRGGKNISASAVEQAAAAHPQVLLAAAVSMPDSVFGEKVCVYAQLQPGAQLKLEQLVDFMRAAGISKENWPERLVPVDEIPRSSGGKVAKAKLREDIRARLDAERSSQH